MVMLPATPAHGPWPTAATRLLVVFGDPVAHSLSPVIHNAALRADGVDAVYLAWHADRDHFAATIDTCVRAGVVGANVTVPHKQAAYALCDTMSDDAKLIGAVNTLLFRNGAIHGENTDVDGFGDDLDVCAVTEKDTPVVVFGTGGAARAVVVACGRRQMDVAVIGRRRDAATELRDLALTAGAGNATAHAIEDADVPARVFRAHVVVNATVLGLRGESVPDVFTRLTADQLAYDLIYAPPRTPFLKAADSAGARTQNGVAMLINQAARAYMLFTGQNAPYDVMRDALTRTLASPS